MTNKDLIKQYVNTGRRISKNQFDKLSTQDKKSYLRVILRSFETDEIPLADYEFDYLSKEEKEKYVEKKFRLDYTVFTDNELNYLPIQLIYQYIFKRISYGYPTTDFEYSFVKDAIIQLEILNSLKNNSCIISPFKIKNSNYETLEKFILSINKAKSRYIFHEQQFLALPDELKKVYLEGRVENNRDIKEYEFEFLTPELKKVYLNYH